MPEERRKALERENSTSRAIAELTRAGITLVVISPDDRYIDDLDLPGRIVRMDEGRFVKQLSLENA